MLSLPNPPEKSDVDSKETLERTSDKLKGGFTSTTVTNSLERSSVGASSFKSKLKALPVATVREKLSFPMKFERSAFCLDFASASGSATSDSESASLDKFRIRRCNKGAPTTSPCRGSKNATMIKKKFSSAEKVKKNPLYSLAKRGIKNNALSRDSCELSSSDSSHPLRLTAFHSSNESPKMLSNSFEDASGVADCCIRDKKLDFKPL